VAALDVVRNDLETVIFDHVVGAYSHEVIPLAVKRHVMGVAHRRTRGVTPFRRALPRALRARALNT